MDDNKSAMALAVGGSASVAAARELILVGLKWLDDISDWVDVTLINKK